MDVQRDTAVEDHFYDQMKVYLAKQDRDYTGSRFHVSDVLFPRKTFFKATVQAPLSRAEMGYFLAGRGHHNIIEAVLAGEHHEEQPIVEERDGITIVGTPDVTENGVPIEVKTSRRWTIQETPDEHYLLQLASYCGLLRQSYGRLIVFYLTPGRNPKTKQTTEPKLVAWTVRFTPEELKSQLDYLFKAGKALRKALDTGVFKSLPLCEEWMCKIRRGSKFEALCPFYDQCQPEGRWPLNP